MKLVKSDDLMVSQKSGYPGRVIGGNKWTERFGVNEDVGRVRQLWPE